MQSLCHDAEAEVERGSNLELVQICTAIQLSVGASQMENFMSAWLPHGLLRGCRHCKDKGDGYSSSRQRLRTHPIRHRLKFILQGTL